MCLRAGRKHLESSARPNGILSHGDSFAMSENEQLTIVGAAGAQLSEAQGAEESPSAASSAVLRRRSRCRDRTPHTLFHSKSFLGLSFVSLKKIVLLGIIAVLVLHHAAKYERCVKNLLASTPSAKPEASVQPKANSSVLRRLAVSWSEDTDKIAEETGDAQAICLREVATSYSKSLAPEVAPETGTSCCKINPPTKRRERNLFYLRYSFLALSITVAVFMVLVSVIEHSYWQKFNSNTTLHNETHNDFRSNQTSTGETTGLVKYWRATGSGALSLALLLLGVIAHVVLRWLQRNGADGDKSVEEGRQAHRSHRRSKRLLGASRDYNRVQLLAEAEAEGGAGPRPSKSTVERFLKDTRFKETQV